VHNISAQKLTPLGEGEKLLKWTLTLGFRVRLDILFGERLLASQGPYYMELNFCAIFVGLLQYLATTKIDSEQLP
jgi:hypothetical protein